jgi:hypothetical protein
VGSGNIVLRRITDHPRAVQVCADALSGSGECPRIRLLQADVSGDDPAVHQSVQPGVADLRELLWPTAVGYDRQPPAHLPRRCESVGGGFGKHDAIGRTEVRQGTHYLDLHAAAISRHYRLDEGGPRGVAARIGSHQPLKVIARKLVYREELRGSTTERGIPINQGIVQVEHHQRHDRH